MEGVCGGGGRGEFDKFMTVSDFCGRVALAIAFNNLTGRRLMPPAMALLPCGRFRQSISMSFPNSIINTLICTSKEFYIE